MREDTVNEAKAKAADAAKKRDEANNNPRRKQIPIEIASLRNKMDAIQINLDKDKEVQEELMEFQKDEAEINEAKISADSEFETLQEEMKESVDPTQFRLFGLDSPPKVLPKRDDDKSGNELQSLIKKARDEIKDKLDEIQSDMEKINESVQNLTEKRDKTSALLDQDKASIVSVKARMTQLQNSVDRNAHVVQKVRTYERSRDRDSDENPFKPDEADPQALLDYLKERLDAIESESTKGVPVAVLKKVMKSLKKRVRQNPIIVPHLFLHSFS
jgi:DNA repair protein RAD50